MRERFGHYTLVKRLAVGGMAEIFLAEHAFAQADHEDVVIKRILPQLSQDPSFVRMFVDEARLAVGLVHPNIVRTFDFGCVDGEHYLTMAHVAGIDLHQLLAGRLQRGQGLGVAASCALGLGLCRGLGSAHRFVSADGTAQHIVHRDVSPHNVMVRRDGTPLLMDFGIAKAAQRQARTATGVGTIKGKLAYMAPEQARGEPATQRSDQYALGVVLYECLAGRRLFAEAPERRLGLQEDTVAVPDLAAVAPGLPPLLTATIMRALNTAPAARFAHVDALGAALAEVCAAHGGEQAATAALAALVVAAQDSEQDEAGDWSWQRGPSSGGGTLRLTPAAALAAAPAHATPATPAGRGGSDAGRSTVTSAPRRVSPRHRACHAHVPRLPAADARPQATPTPARALLRQAAAAPARRASRSALHLWWALWAATCGATGNVQDSVQRLAQLPTSLICAVTGA